MPTKCGAVLLTGKLNPNTMPGKFGSTEEIRAESRILTGVAHASELENDPDLHFLHLPRHARRTGPYGPVRLPRKKRAHNRD
jgi:hypothetical protein